MKLLAYLMLTFLGISTIRAITPYNQVTQLEQALNALETSMGQREQQIISNVFNNHYSDYPNRRAQELIARLGLREFNTSINPFTHIGRYMDQNAGVHQKYPDNHKQEKLRKELCEIIIEQELQSARTHRKKIMKDLRQAVVHQEFIRLNQKKGYELTKQDFKQLKVLKRLVDQSYRQDLKRRISDYDNQISHLRSEISSLRSMREAALSLHHSSCMVCMTCKKSMYTCHMCHACVDHCGCTYQVAKSVLALIADISAQASIDTLKQRLYSLEAARNKLKNKLNKLDKAENIIWENYLKNRLQQLQQYQINAANYASAPMNAYSDIVNPVMTNYHIQFVQQDLGYAPAVQYHDNSAAFVGLGCAALAGAGLIAICYGASHS